MRQIRGPPGDSVSTLTTLLGSLCAKFKEQGAVIVHGRARLHSGFEVRSCFAFNFSKDLYIANIVNGKAVCDANSRASLSLLQT